MQKNYLVILLTLLVALSGLSIDIYLPSLPSIQHYFHTDSAHIQLTLSLYMFGFAICMLLSGPLCDYYGRRPVILSGIAIHFFATILCIVSTSIELFIVGRFFQALGGCCGTVIGRVIVRDKFAGSEIVNVLTWLTAGTAISPVIAPVIGGFIENYLYWKLNFVLLAIISFLLFIFSYYFLAESLTHKKHDSLNLTTLSKNFLSALCNKNYIAYTLVISFAWAGFFAYLSTSVFIFINIYNFTPLHYSIVYSLMISAYIFGSFLARKLSKLSISTLVMRSTQIASMAGIILFVANYYFSTNILSIILPMLIYLIAIGILMPNAQAGALATFTHTIGSIAGLLYFIEMLFGTLTGLIIGFSSSSPQMIFVYILSISALAMSSIFYFLKWR